MDNTKEFVVYRDSIIEALDHLEEFKEKMDKFVKARPNYKYSVSINEVGSVWEIKAKVNKDEHEDIKAT